MKTRCSSAIPTVVSYKGKYKTKSIIGCLCYNIAQFKLVSGIYQLTCINTYIISSIRLSALMHHFMSSMHASMKNHAIYKYPCII